MITVKVSIIDEQGQSVAVERQYVGELAGKNLDEIESFISQVKTDTMQASELALLDLNQSAATKKK
jgi:hypothetical protein